MGNVLSMDLRHRFKGLMESGLCAAAAGCRLLISRATAARWGKKVREGQSLLPQPAGVRKGSGWLEPYVPFLTNRIAQNPESTLEDLRTALSDVHCVSCSTSGIDALLRRHGYTYKKRPDRRRARQIRGAPGPA